MSRRAMLSVATLATTSTSPKHMVANTSWRWRFVSVISVRSELVVVTCGGPGVAFMAVVSVGVEEKGQGGCVEFALVVGGDDLAESCGEVVEDRSSEVAELREREVAVKVGPQ